MSRCSSRRLPAEHCWPLLKQKAPIAVAAAAVEGRIGEHDVRRLAAELERDRLVFDAAARITARPATVEPVKAILSTSVEAAKSLAARRHRGRGREVTTLNTPGGQAGLAEELREQRRSGRGTGGTAWHDGAAGGERRCSLHRDPSSGKFQAVMSAGDPDRLAQDQAEGVRGLRSLMAEPSRRKREPRVVVEGLDGDAAPRRCARGRACPDSSTIRSASSPARSASRSATRWLSTSWRVRGPAAGPGAVVEGATGSGDRPLGVGRVAIREVAATVPSKGLGRSKSRR